MIERELDVTTPEGKMKTFIYHPQHEGPHPVVLYLMDAPSIRPALKDMDTRLASAGYYVMLPYLFYRGGPFREFREFGKSDEDMHARRELMAGVTPTNMVSDAKALLAVADADSAAARGKIGAVGFCMSGGLVIALALRAAGARRGGGQPVAEAAPEPDPTLPAATRRRSRRGRAPRPSSTQGSRSSSINPGPGIGPSRCPIRDTTSIRHPPDRTRLRRLPQRRSRPVHHEPWRDHSQAHFSATGADTYPSQSFRWIRRPMSSSSTAPTGWCGR